MKHFDFDIDMIIVQSAMSAIAGSDAPASIIIEDGGGDEHIKGGS